MAEERRTWGQKNFSAERETGKFLPRRCSVWLQIANWVYVLAAWGDGVGELVGVQYSKVSEEPLRNLASLNKGEVKGHA